MKTRQQIKSNLKPFNHVIQICGCTQCRHGRYSFKAHIKRLQKKIRTYWKRGKEVTLGLYTD